jgi:hypothetical protein
MWAVAGGDAAASGGGAGAAGVAAGADTRSIGLPGEAAGCTYCWERCWVRGRCCIDGGSYTTSERWVAPGAAGAGSGAETKRSNTAGADDASDGAEALEPEAAVYTSPNQTRSYYYEHEARILLPSGQHLNSN